MRALSGIAYYTRVSCRLPILWFLAIAVCLGFVAPVLAFGSGWVRMTAGAAITLGIVPLGVCCFLIAFPAEHRPQKPGVGFPARLFLLPVKTRTLVLSPLLFGSASLSLLWVILAIVVRSVSGSSPPVLVPCLALAGYLAWMQAAAWAPIGRVQVLALLGSFLIPLEIFTGFMEGAYRLPESTMIAFLCSSLVLAYGTALAGVESDRRGDTWMPERGIGRRTPQRLRSFRSPQRALASIVSSLLWMDLSFIAPMMFFLACAGLIIIFRDKFRSDSYLLFLALACVAPLQVTGMRRRAPLAGIFGEGARQAAARGMFVLPVTDAAISSAMFRTSLLFALSMSISYLITLALIAALLALVTWEAGFQFIADGISAIFLHYPGWQGVAVLALSAALVPGVIWRSMTDMLLARMLEDTKSRARYAVLLSMCVLNGAIVLGVLLALDLPAVASVAGIYPWLIGVVLGVKGLVAAAAFRVASRRGLIERRPLCESLAVAALFAAAAVSLVALLLGQLDVPVSKGVFFAGALALVPLGRFALVPLALERQRHA